MTHTNLGGFHL